VGLTAATLGRLNMTTALIFAVLLGLGIDIGVHVTLRYLDERARGSALELALGRALTHTGKAVLAAGLTTAAGLAVLIFADFKGFEEFGVIAAMGILTCLLVYVSLLPALATLFERIAPPKPWRAAPVALPDTSHPTRRPGPLRLGLLALLVATVTAASVVALGRVEFEYDFRNLRGEKISTGIKYSRSVGGSKSPAVAVLPDPASARAVTRELERIIDGYGADGGELKRAASLYSFVPDRQDEKRPLLARLGEIADQGLALPKLRPETRRQLEELKRWSAAPPVSTDELPTWLTDKFREKDGTLGRIVYLTQRANQYLVRESEQFYERFGVLALPGGGQVRSAASSFILVEVVRAVQRDGRMMTVAASLAVLLLVFLDLRSLGRTLIVFAPVAIGMCWSAGLIALFGLKLGLYNMLVLPLLLGVGVDSSIHFYHSYVERGPGSLGLVLRTTGKGIAVAAATTGVGFVGMMIASHAGLRTIGQLAVLGIAGCLAATLTVLPLLLALGEAWNRSKKPPQGRLP
jgi:predicted RND superfamily exporter protein